MLWHWFGIGQERFEAHSDWLQCGLIAVQRVKQRQCALAVMHNLQVQFDARLALRADGRRSQLRATEKEGTLATEKRGGSNYSLEPKCRSGSNNDDRPMDDAMVTAFARPNWLVHTCRNLSHTPRDAWAKARGKKRGDAVALDT